MIVTGRVPFPVPVATRPLPQQREGPSHVDGSESAAGWAVVDRFAERLIDLCWLKQHDRLVVAQGPRCADGGSHGDRGLVVGQVGDDVDVVGTERK